MTGCNPVLSSSCRNNSHSQPRSSLYFRSGFQMTPSIRSGMNSRAFVFRVFVILLMGVSLIRMSAHRAPRWVAAKQASGRSFTCLFVLSELHVGKKGWMLHRWFPSADDRGAQPSGFDLMRFQIGEHFLGAI